MDTFEGRSVALSDPANQALEITPNDQMKLPYVSRALYVGGGGNVTLELSGGDQVTFFGVAGGTILPIRVHKVLATGTTATHMICLW